MAEDTVKDRVYDPSREKSQQQKRGLTRRDFLAVLGGLGLGAIIGTKITEPSGEKPKTQYETLIEQGIKPKKILLGDLKITKGGASGMLNVRSEPNTTSTSTDWLNIQKWDGVDIQYVPDFIIKNALFVEGENTDPQGSKGEKGLWAVGIVATTGFVKKEEPGYLSFSAQTGPLVNFASGQFHNITEFNKDWIRIETGEKIPGDQIGTVVPRSKVA